ncbi:MAG: amino acid permease [Halobacteriota archaeon]
MTKELERDLGLFAVLAISIGAMVGSGIFILPALAISIAGPAVIAAYVLAGILVLPAALSKSEMATAMPESGGTYIYIERGMGPLLGTIAGLGTWFSLSFKSALALVGGVPYLLLLTPGAADLVTPVALGLASLLVLVNLLGAKQTGRLQVGIVVVMLLALVWFVFGGTPAVDSARYQPFFTRGVDGLLAATGLVFVSYAGVTKIASVAEEVENPSRNIPIGILGSLAFITALYALIVAVMVGVADPTTIGDTLTPMADVAEVTLGSAGVVAVIGAAVLALVSTANAGILSSSRYPFAMSRDRLIPETFRQVSDRFGTPSSAITLTGVVLLILIAFVPILEIAKLASAFQILVFILINLAHVAFREGAAEYNPPFEAPLYPWMQVFGALSGAVLLTQMGTVPLVGAVVIVLASALWYLFYVRSRVDREGAVVVEARRRVVDDALDETVTALDADGCEVLVALDESVDPEVEQTLVSLGTDIAGQRGGRLAVVQFQTVADQVPLDHAASVQSPADEAFESRIDETTAGDEVSVTRGEIVSHDVGRAVVNYAGDHRFDVLLMAGDVDDVSRSFGGGHRHHIVSAAPCEVLVFDGAPIDALDEVWVTTDRRPYDAEKLAIADAIATAHDAVIRLRYQLTDDSSSRQTESIDEYHTQLSSMCRSPVLASVARGDGGHPTDDGPCSTLLVTTDLETDFKGPRIFVVPRSERRPGVLRRLAARVIF